MENTAAITFREALLTIDDKTASVDAHQAVVGVLAHEMAHQWFGDLVIPGTKRVLENAKDAVNACIELRSLQQAKLAEYLKTSPAKNAAGASGLAR
jgi:hypothetical protein